LHNLENGYKLIYQANLFLEIIIDKKPQENLERVSLKLLERVVLNQP